MQQYEHFMNDLKQNEDILVVMMMGDVKIVIKWGADKATVA